MSVIAKRFYLALVITVILSGVLPVSAHGYIVRSIPEDRVTLERPPTRLQYWFSEDLEPAFSELNLRDETGTVIARGGVDEQDRSLLALQLPAGMLDDGAYIVELRPAFASDGHVVVESRVFFVGEQVSGVSGETASDLAEPLEVIWKTLLFASLFLLFGLYVTYAHVLVPAWGSSKYPSGWLPPRVMTRLNTAIWISLVVAVLANMLALVQQSMVFFNVDAAQVIQGNLWQVVRIGSRTGDVWNVRMLFLAVVAAFQLASYVYRNIAPRSVRAFWTANVWLMALIIGAQAVNSHAAGSLVLPWVAVIVHWLHTLAVAFWIGGITALVLVLPVALAPYEPDARQQALLAVMRRFSRLVVGAVLLVITSGIYSATNWFFTPEDVATTYGTALALKLLMVGLLLIVGLLHHVALRPHLLARFPFKELVHRAGNFALSLRLEVIMAFITIGLAALLTATPVPEPAFLTEIITTPSDSAQVDDLTVGVNILPGGPGVNTFDVVVARDDEPVTDAAISLQLVAPARDVRSAWESVDEVDRGLYVTASDSIDEAGLWWTVIDMNTGDTIRRVVFAWDISDDAAVIQTLDPGLLNLLALAGVIVAVGFLMYPSLARLYARLPLNRATLIVAIGVTVISIGVIAFSIETINQQQIAFERTLNPLPDVVNIVLPDAESLARGESLYQAHCNWTGQDDYDSLRRNLSVLRDDELYRAIDEGWRDLPACQAALSDEEHWDLVNYLRTLRPERGN